MVSPFFGLPISLREVYAIRPGHTEGADVVSDVRRAAYGIDFANMGIGFDDPG